jgi:hypothetical protein
VTFLLGKALASLTNITLDPIGSPLKNTLAYFDEENSLVSLTPVVNVIKPLSPSLMLTSCKQSALYGKISWTFNDRD